MERGESGWGEPVNGTFDEKWLGIWGSQVIYSVKEGNPEGILVEKGRIAVMEWKKHVAGEALQGDRL